MLKRSILTLFLMASALPLIAAEGVARGTGFAISADGHILTNAHVVSGCNQVVAKVRGLEMRAQIVAVDAQNDLALLKILGTFITVLPLREGTRVQLGEPVVAFGYPLQGVISSSLNMTIGNVSALAGLGDDTRSLQFTAPIQPGNSGGPLVDASGDVVGVVTSKLSPLWAAKNTGDLPQNVNFALKASVIRDFLETRGVEYQAKGLVVGIPVTDLPDKVSGTVFPLRCFEDVAAKDAKPNAVSGADSPSVEKHPGVMIAGYGDARLFQTIFLALENALTAFGVMVANRPSTIGQVNGDSSSIQNFLSIIQRQRSDSLLYLTVENTGFKIHALVQCFDVRGTLLWEERITNRVSITWEGATRNVVDQLKKRLKPRVGKLGLPSR